VCPARANALDANRPKPFEAPVTTMILRIPNIDPFLDCSRNQGSSHRNGQMAPPLAHKICRSIPSRRRGRGTGAKYTRRHSTLVFLKVMTNSKTHEIYQSARKGRVLRGGRGMSR